MKLDELYTAMCKETDGAEAGRLYNLYYMDALKAEGFNAAQAALIAGEAYDRGHSAGYCEVVGITLGLVYFVKQILAAK